MSKNVDTLTLRGPGATMMNLLDPEPKNLGCYISQIEIYQILLGSTIRKYLYLWIQKLKKATDLHKCVLAGKNGPCVKLAWDIPRS